MNEIIKSEVLYILELLNTEIWQNSALSDISTKLCTYVIYSIQKHFQCLATRKSAIFSKWWPNYKKTVSGRRNSLSLFHVCAKYIFVALNMIFSCICFTIFFKNYLTKNNLYNRNKYEISDLFFTTRAHLYKSMPINSALASVLTFVQSTPKYFMA